MENTNISGKSFMIESMVTVSLIFLVIISIALVVQYLINRSKKVKTFGGEKYYTHKPNLLTKSENFFIKELHKIIPDNIVICPQVRMADILVVSDKVKKKPPNS